MGAIDWTVFLVFMAYVVWDGARRVRGSRDLEGYFAGGRSVAWWAAGLSIMATQASAITVIGTTGQGCEQGMEFVQLYFGLAFAMVIISILFVPLYRAQPILTAYEYLEGRFGPGTRTLASLIFLVSRCLAFGVVLYAPAVVLSAMLKVDVTYTVIVVGGLTTLYTMMGGVNAVIATDVKQMVVIIGGLLLVCGILLAKVLQHVDLTGLLHVLGGAGKLNAVQLDPQASFVPRLTDELAQGIGIEVQAEKSFWENKYNFWSGLIGGLFLHLAYFGTDQSQVQRILTNPTAKQSRQALLMSAFAKVPMQALVLFIGVLLYGFLVLSPAPAPMLFNPEHQQRAADGSQPFATQVEDIRAEYGVADARRRLAAYRLARAEGDPVQHPALLAEFRASAVQVDSLRKQARDLVASDAEKLTGKTGDTNFLFPWFILNHVPVVLLGLMIAAIFAAAMSSADSALNSLTSATVVDFYRRLVNPASDERRAMQVSRWTTLFWGASATVAALFFQGAGSVIEVINRVGSYFYGSLLGVFLLALVCRRARGRAGVWGLVGGMVAVLVVDQTVRVEYLWYNVIGAVAVLMVGYGVSFLERTNRREPEPG